VGKPTSADIVNITDKTEILDALIPIVSSQLFSFQSSVLNYRLACS
jgi:hypothetical protein